jgi:hypothetical protein
MEYGEDIQQAVNLLHKGMNQGSPFSFLPHLGIGAEES